MKFKIGDTVTITNLPKKWTSAVEVGKKYTIFDIHDSEAYKGKKAIRFKEVPGIYVLEEHIDFPSKLHKVLR